MTPLARIAVAFAAAGLFIGTVVLSVNGTPTYPPTTIPNLPPLTISIAPTPPGSIGTSAAAIPLVAPTTTASPPVPDGRALAVVPSWARCPQWWRAAQRAGWPVGLLPTLDYVMHRESRCIPTAANDFGYTGLIQIGRAHLSAPGYTGLCARTKGRICTADDLKKPRKNLRAGWLMYQDAQRIWGCGWHHWYLGSWRPC